MGWRSPRTSPRPASLVLGGAFLAKVREVSVLGDYPTRGRRLWLFLAAVAVIGLFGLVMMLFSASKG